MNATRQNKRNLFLLFLKKKSGKKIQGDVSILNWKEHAKILAVLKEKSFTRKSQLGHASSHSITITKIHEDVLEIIYAILKTYTMPCTM